MGRKSLRWPRVACAVLGALAYMGTTAVAQEEPKQGGTVIFAITDDPTGLNRNISSNNTDGLVACAIYQGLTNVDSEGNIHPILAKSWTISEDGRTYTFDLVDANWQDGKPFTSEDVKYTYLEVSSKHSAIFSGAGRAIEAIETPAPNKVVIRLKHPYGPLLNSLACSQGGAVLPAHIFGGTDVLTNPAVSAPVGTGPFMLKEWKRGDYVHLTRNPDYWEEGKPYLDDLIAKIVPQAAGRTRALLAGEVDFTPYLYLAASDYEVVKANPDLRLSPAPHFPSVDFMFLNVTREPFDDPRVRQALMMSIDREYLVKAGWQGLGSVGTMPFTNRLEWAANPDVDYTEMYPFDPARAEALFDEAGLPRGADGTRFTMNIVYPTSYTDSPLVATALKSMFAKVGVALEILPAETTAAAKRIYTDRDFDSAFGLYTSFGDPALGMARAFVSTSIGKAFGNASGYSNPEIDDLFRQAEIAPNQEARGEIYKEIQARLGEELPTLTLHEIQMYEGASKDLKGTLEGEGFLPSWRNAWLDR